MFCLLQLSVRGKNKKEKLEDFFKNVVKSADGVLVAGVKVRTPKPESRASSGPGLFHICFLCLFSLFSVGVSGCG